MKCYLICCHINDLARFFLNTFSPSTKGPRQFNQATYVMLHELIWILNNINILTSWSFLCTTKKKVLKFISATYLYSNKVHAVNMFYHLLSCNGQAFISLVQLYCNYFNIIAVPCCCRKLYKMNSYLKYQNNS